MHGNIKLMLRSLVQCKYVLQTQSEEDIANIHSRLDCEYERFDESYPSDDTLSLYLSLQSVILFTAQHDERNKLYTEVGIGSCWTDQVGQLHLKFTLAVSYVLWN